MELLKWRDKRRSNPNNIVQQFADIKKVTFDEMFEEMFELNLRRREHVNKVNILFFADTV